jgi:hypothetical protein
MTWCGVYQVSEATDALTMAREQGEKNVALRIVQLIGLRPEDAPANAWDDSELLERMIRSRGD